MVIRAVGVTFCACCCAQDENAEHKVYVRKLEARLDELKNAADISSKYQAAKQKVGGKQLLPA